MKAPGLARGLAWGPALTSEQGGIVTGWLIRIVVGLAFAGLLLYEAGAVVVTKVSVEQVATEAASEAGLVYETSNSKEKATERAREVAGRSGAELLNLRTVPDRQLLEVTLRKKAPTVFIHRLGFLERFSEAETTKRGTIR